MGPRRFRCVLPLSALRVGVGMIRGILGHYAARSIREAGRQMSRDIAAQRLAYADAGLTKITPEKRAELETTLWGDK